MNLFRTIAGSDWRDALARSRTESNPVSAQIREIISAKNMNTAPSKQRSHVSIYFAIHPGIAEPLVPVWGTHYESLRKAAAEVGGIVTNESWMRSAGAVVDVAFGTKQNGGTDLTKPASVTVNGSKLSCITATAIRAII
jgi:hypothetical protein